MSKKSAALRFVILIAVGLFFSEVATMGIISLFPQIPYAILSIFDGLLLVIFAVPILFYFSLRPLLKVTSDLEDEIERRKDIEKQLRLQTTAVETAANGIIITDNAGKIIWANQAFGEMSGYPVAEVLGRKTSILNSGVQNADFYKNLWDTVLAGKVWRGEIVNRRKDGGLYVGEQTITPVRNPEGEIEYLIAIQQNVTERKEAEAALRAGEHKFRTLLEWTYDWEMWVDAKDQVIYSSPSCLRITGYPSESFMNDAQFLVGISHPEDMDLYRAHIHQTHDDKSDSINIEYRIITRDGRVRWIEHACRPIFEGEHYLGRRVSNRDITDRKNTERERVERTAKEKLLVETIHNMQIDIARDLHDSIGQNVGYLRMTLDRLSDEESRRHTDMQSEIKNLGRVADETYDLIRGMLAMLQSGGSSDPMILFTRYADHVAKRSSFDIKITNHGTAHPLSSHQMRQLFYVFREALSNMEKYAQPCSASAGFNWGEDSLTLIFSDNGRGFDVNNLPPGNHYGLKFMRERVELLKGAFALNSKIGEGTEIRITIPYE